jgi:hypothetical protein
LAHVHRVGGDVVGEVVGSAVFDAAAHAAAGDHMAQHWLVVVVRLLGSPSAPWL